MIALVAGTRPNFMKVAPDPARARAARGFRCASSTRASTSTPSMSEVFFRDLGLPPPDVHADGRGGTHAEQTAAVLVGVEDGSRGATAADLVVVVGDVTSTLAAALAAAKLGVPVAHVEAGLRSHDWTMPEEINRVLTDQLSDLCLYPSRDAEREPARARASPRERIVFVGNVMIDSLYAALGRRTDVLARLGLRAARLRAWRRCTAPRTSTRAPRSRPRSRRSRRSPRACRWSSPCTRAPSRAPRRSGSRSACTRSRGCVTIEPLGYDDFVTLMSDARLVATDSGGIQEETTVLGIPCLTLREGTERPVTVTEGTNVVVGLDTGRIAAEVDGDPARPRQARARPRGLGRARGGARRGRPRRVPRGDAAGEGPAPRAARRRVTLRGATSGGSSRASCRRRGRPSSRS